MRPKWPKLASLAQKTCTLYTLICLVYSLIPKDNPFLRPYLFWKMHFLCSCVWCWLYGVVICSQHVTEETADGLASYFLK